MLSTWKKVSTLLPTLQAGTSSPRYLLRYFEQTSRVTSPHPSRRHLDTLTQTSFSSLPLVPFSPTSTSGKRLLLASCIPQSQLQKRNETAAPPIKWSPSPPSGCSPSEDGGIRACPDLRHYLRDNQQVRYPALRPLSLCENIIPLWLLVRYTDLQPVGMGAFGLVWYGRSSPPIPPFPADLPPLARAAC